jgi:hypothetical protein
MDPVLAVALAFAMRSSVSLVAVGEGAVAVASVRCVAVVEEETEGVDRHLALDRELMHLYVRHNWYHHQVRDALPPVLVLLHPAVSAQEPRHQNQRLQ